MFYHYIQVAVNTTLTNLRQFLDHLIATTNMRSLTPEGALSGECGMFVYLFVLF
jgi:coatomer subunit beta